MLGTFATFATSLCYPFRSVLIRFMTELFPPMRIDTYNTLFPEFSAVA